MLLPLENCTVSLAHRFWENTVAYLLKPVLLYTALFKFSQVSVTEQNLVTAAAKELHEFLFLFFCELISEFLVFVVNTNKILACPGHCYKITFSSCHIQTCTFDLEKCMYICLFLTLLEVFITYILIIALVFCFYLLDLKGFFLSPDKYIVPNISFLVNIIKIKTLYKGYYFNFSFYYEDEEVR